MSLHDFIAAHRDELVLRTRAKVAERPSPPPSDAQLEHGVPLFLAQLGEALAREQRSPAQDGADGATEIALAPPPDTNAAIARGARLHGQDLRRLGFTIDQVVHDYGDVCQAVTELVLEEKATVTTAEFHTLNRCLDNAIAGAVTSWNEERERSRPPPPTLDTFREELRAELQTAIAAFEALRTGRVGPSGATALVAGRCLNRMLSLLRDPKKGM